MGPKQLSFGRPKDVGSAQEAVAVTVTVTNNEMAVFSADSLSRIWSKTEKNVDWTGMMAIDHLRAEGEGQSEGAPRDHHGPASSD